MQLAIPLRRLCLYVGLLSWLLLPAKPVEAAIETRVFQGEGTFSSEGTLTAHVLFSYDDVSDELTVTLTNPSLADVARPSQLLGAVFFNGIDQGALGKIEARLGSNSEVLYFNPSAKRKGKHSSAAQADGTLDGAGDISPEWAFRDDLQLNVFGGADRMLGISATGLGVFGPKNLFDEDLTHDLDGPNSPGGANYLIASAGDDPGTGNKGVTKQPVVQHQVNFRFAVLTPISLNELSDVVFQFGTGFGEPAVYAQANGPPAVMTIPEPSSALILGGLVLCFVLAGWWRLSRTLGKCDAD